VARVILPLATEFIAQPPASVEAITEKSRVSIARRR
jgi:hypothetical protein